MNQRFYSLDVFRGATVALMILVNTPGSWAYIYGPLKHADWHGVTPTDLVFPFFLFAVGNAMAFVMPRLIEGGPSVFWKKVTKRFLLIFLIGLLLNWFPFVRYDADGHLVMKTFEKLRILGVLQRIAVCYFFASIIIYYFKSRGAFVVGAIMLLIYWGLCLALGDPADPYSLNGFFGTGIDKYILGENHMYHGEGVAFDPEGLMSTIPAIVQVIFGFLVGEYIIKKGKTWEMLSNLFVAGMILIFAGFCWHTAFPINKKIWTSSYVLYTTGLALSVLGVLIYLIEFKNAKGAWSKFFDVFGKNPLFIFVLSGAWSRIYGLFRIEDGMKDGKPVIKGLGGWMDDHLFSPALGNMNGSLAYAIFHILIFWAICWWLDKRKIYIKV
jgi:predicted acyltransferase